MQPESKPGTNQELDLHGLTVDEAVPRIEDFIYRAYQAGHINVWIIHGKGTGVLKGAVSRILAGSSLVRSFYTADKYHGGDGATQVNLVL